uniref:Uncharacterized protein n=1 Tax=Davidia involucrata TaxID=16924 RepID=A0A5B7AXC0_DAVIN
MAETRGRNSGNRRQPSRLQRRAPASIQIIPVSDWKVAIPLLSPLVSPSSPKSHDQMAEMKSSKEESIKQHNHHHSSNQVTEPEKTMVFKKWQHPAAPFCYEPAPLVPFF